MPTRIAICLFEESITSLDISYLLCGNPLTKVTLTDDDSDTLLYLKESNSNTPEWVYIVKQFCEIGNKNVDTASSGAILFLKIHERIIGCCFGSSVGNINKDNLVTDFGLGAAYQRIDQRNYKTIESQILSINPLTNNRSSAITTTQDSFNIDNVLETITELSGKSYSSLRRQIVKGKEFFSTPSPLNLDDIKNLCADLLDDYKKSIEDEVYKSLTSTKKVKVKALLDYLNQSLCDKMTKKDLNVSLLDFELLPEIDTYSFSSKGNKLTEISIDDLYGSFKSNFKITLSYLKTKRISIFDKDKTDLGQWSLFKCLFLSLKVNNGTYILYKGNWYEVEPRHIDDLKTFISHYEVSSMNLNFPKWDGKMAESKYNYAASVVLNGQCWDKILYTHPRYSYGIEFCDILTGQNIIHVKKLSSSSLNSHLLLQTAVSASLLLNDVNIKTWIKVQSRKNFTKNIFLKKNNEFKNSNIQYLILLLTTSNKSLSEDLPFFSLISFNLIIKRLIQMGYSVKIAKA